MQQRLEQVSGRQPGGHEGSEERRVCSSKSRAWQGRQIRSDLARTVVNSGWNLSELRAVGLSLEDIFLQLTAAEKKTEAEQEEGVTK